MNFLHVALFQSFFAYVAATTGETALSGCPCFLCLVEKLWATVNRKQKSPLIFRRCVLCVIHRCGFGDDSTPSPRTWSLYQASLPLPTPVASSGVRDSSGGSTANTDAGDSGAGLLDKVEKAEQFVSIAGEVVDSAQAAVAAIPPDVLDAGATFAVEQAPRIVGFIGSLCGGAAALLGAIAPALPFVGSAVSLGALALGQVQKYTDALDAVAALSGTVASVSGIVEQFKDPVLALPHARLLTDTLTTLRDATTFLAKNFGGGKPRPLKAVVAFLCADANLQTLTEARARLDTLVGHMGDAGGVAAALSAAAAAADTRALLAGQARSDAVQGDVRRRGREGRKRLGAALHWRRRTLLPSPRAPF
jgi:hypothetical protein